MDSSGLALLGNREESEDALWVASSSIGKHGYFGTAMVVPAFRTSASSLGTPS